MAYPVPEHEAERMRELVRYDILDTPPEESFDRISRLAADLLDVPIALVSLIDRDRQWIKSCFGVDLRQTDREMSFCTHAILSEDILVVDDLAADPRFVDNPFVTGDPGLRFYAGAPLLTPSGHILGTLCVLDTTPRTLSERHIRQLEDLAAMVVDELELRREISERRRIESDLRESEARFRTLVEQSHDWIWEMDPDGRFTYVSPGATEILGYDTEALIGQTSFDFMTSADTDQFANVLTSHVERKEGFERIEKMLIHRGGYPVVVETSGTPRLDDAGELIGYQGIARDITERKRGERRQALQNRILAGIAQGASLDETLHAIATFVEQAGLATGVSIFRLDPATETLQVGAATGLPDAFVTAFHGSSVASGTGACGRAIRDNERISVSDAIRDEPDAMLRARMQRHGLQASVSRPIQGENASVLGVCTLWFDAPHHPKATNQSLADLADLADLAARLAGVAIDSHQTRDRLRRKRILLDQSQHLGKIGGWEIDLRTGRLHWTDETYHLHGLPLEHEPTVEDALTFYPPEARRTLRTALERAVQEQNGWSLELPFITANGERRWMRSIGEPNVVDGAVVQVAGTLQDVTRRKRAENEVDNFFELSIDIMCIAQRDGYFTRVNPAFEQVLGYSAEELTQRSYLDFIHPDDVEQTRRAMGQLSEGQDVVDFVNRYRRQDGTYRVLEWRAISYTDNGLTYAAARDITERRKAERALRQYAEELEAAKMELEASQARIERVFESISDAFFAVDHDWTFTYLNSHADKLLSKLTDNEHEDLVGANVWDAFPEAIETAFYDQYHEAVETGESVHFEAYYPPGDVWFAVSAYPFEDGLSVYFTDVTQRKQALHALKDSEARFRGLVSNLPGIVYRCTYDSNWDTLYASSGWEDVCGHPSEPFVSNERSFIDIVVPEDLPKIRKVVRQAVRQKRAFEVEYRIRRADGSISWIQDLARPCFDEDGGVKWLDGVMFDITERKQTEERLRLLETAVHEAKEAVLITDAQLDRPGPVIRYVNRGFEAMTGYSADEVIGKTPRLLQGPKTDRAVLDKLQASLERGEPFAGETINYHKDGTPFHLEWSISPVRDPKAGHITHYVAVERDISERKAAEQQMREALEKERELSNLKSRFVSMASHELRTPLATIQSSAELVDLFIDRGKTGKVSKHLDRIQDNVEKMAGLLEDVLVFGRAEQGQMPFRPEEIDLVPLTRKLVDELRQGIGVDHDIVVHGLDEALTVEADAQLIRLVMNNLLSNAIKYSPAGSRVTLQLDQGVDEVVCRVADEGIGIPADDLDRLFEPFHRAENVGTTGGTGLGLAIVQEAVDVHEGRVAVDTAEGEGTEFTVRFPLRRSQHVSA